MKLQTKLLVVGILLTVVPLLTVSAIVFRENREMVKVADEENTRMAYETLDQIAQGIYRLCEAQNDIVQKNVNHSLNVARDVQQNTGKIGFSDETITEKAIAFDDDHGDGFEQFNN